MLTSQQTLNDRPQPGELVIGAKGKYRIEKYLGEGITSLVYQAVVEDGEWSGECTALKILRTDASADAKSSFNMERTVLAELRRAELEAKDNVSSIPWVYEAYSGEDGQFLALEFVKGEPLDRTLDRTGRMEESQALVIASQVLRVLDLLHTQVRRSYTDLQMQNIWWHKAEGRDGYLVKVMDWNHVSYQFPASEGVPPQETQRDLARFGAYLYRMLTGKGASEYGETERALERRAGSQWRAVSLGGRQIVLRALHPNREKRFANAVEFRTEVAELHAAWNMSWSELDAKIDELLGDLEEHFNEALAYRVEVLLDVFERNHTANPRTKDEAKAFRDRLNAVLEPQIAQPQRESADAWKAGQNYYRAGQYEEAGKRWRELAEGSGRLGHWRWVMLAGVGYERRQLFEEWRADLENAVDLLDQEQWADAAITIERANSDIRSRGVDALYGEVRARRAIEDGRRQEAGDSVEVYRAAAANFRSADAALASVPYEKLLRDEFGWHDLTERAQQLENRADARTAAERKIRALAATAQSADFDTQLQALREVLQTEPRNTAAVAMCLSEAQKAQKKGENDHAIALLDVVLLYGQVPEQDEALRLLRDQASEAAQAKREQILEAVKAERNRKRWVALQDQARELVQADRWLELRELLEKVPGEYAPLVIAPEDQKRIQDAYADAIKQRDVPLAQVLRDIFNRIEPDQQRQKERADAYSGLLNQLHRHREEWLADVKRAVILSAPSTIAEREDLIKKIDKQLALLNQDEDADLLLQAQNLRMKLVDEIDALRNQETVRRQLDDRLGAAKQSLARMNDESLGSVAEICAAIRDTAQTTGTLGIFGADVDRLEAAARALRAPLEDLNRAENWLAEAERIKRSPDADLLGLAAGNYAAAATDLAEEAAAAAAEIWVRFLGEPAPAFQRPARIKAGAAPLVSPEELKAAPSPVEQVGNAAALPAVAPTTSRSSGWAVAGRVFLAFALITLGGLLVWLMIMQLPQLEERLSYRVEQVETQTKEQIARVADVLVAVRASDGRMESLSNDVAALSKAQASGLAALGAKVAAIQTPPTSALMLAPAPANEPTPQPTAETPASTVSPSVEATVAPTPIPTATATIPPGVPTPNPFFDPDAGPEVLYDLPAFVLRPNADEKLFWDAASEQLEVVTKDGAEWLATTEITGTQQTSPIPARWEGTNLNETVRLSPASDEPPLAAGQYALTLQYQAEPQGWVVASQPITFTVASAPAKATLLLQELRKEPIARTGENLQWPQPIARGADLEVLYWEDHEGFRLYEVRVPNSRRTGWVMGPVTKQVIRVTWGDLKDVPPKKP